MSHRLPASDSPKTASTLSADTSKIRALLQRFRNNAISERGLMIWATVESVLPVLPPELVIVPLTAREPHQANKFIRLATLCSLCGAVYSYALGNYSELLFRWDSVHSSIAGIDWIVSAFDNWGEGIVFLGAFLPLPLALFALAAGLLNLGLLPFIVTVALGRLLRFYIVTRIVTTVHKQ